MRGARMRAAVAARIAARANLNRVEESLRSNDVIVHPPFLAALLDHRHDEDDAEQGHRLRGRVAEAELGKTVLVDIEDEHRGGARGPPSELAAGHDVHLIEDLEGPD